MTRYDVKLNLIDDPIPRSIKARLVFYYGVVAPFAMRKKYWGWYDAKNDEITAPRNSPHIEKILAHELGHAQLRDELLHQARISRFYAALMLGGILQLWCSGASYQVLLIMLLAVFIPIKILGAFQERRAWREAKAIKDVGVVKYE